MGSLGFGVSGLGTLNPAAWRDSVAACHLPRPTSQARMPKRNLNPAQVVLLPCQRVDEGRIPQSRLPGASFFFFFGGGGGAMPKGNLKIVVTRIVALKFERNPF